MTSRKKPGVAFWATVGLVVIVLYVLSFGPACWLAFNVLPESMFPAFEVLYAPLDTCADLTEPTKKALRWYTDLWFDSARLR
jgi:hypothetical protein